MSGEVWLRSLGHRGARLTATLTGLSPGDHGLHVHSMGNPLDACGAACAHFNPFGSVHGGPESEHHHAGDLGNITAGHDGVARMDAVFPSIFLSGPLSVVGRSIIVHADPDDLGTGGRPGSRKREESLKTGNAGKRTACAVIGIAAEERAPPLTSPYTLFSSPSRGGGFTTRASCARAVAS